MCGLHDCGIPLVSRNHGHYVPMSQAYRTFKGSVTIGDLVYARQDQTHSNLQNYLILSWVRKSSTNGAK